MGLRELKKRKTRKAISDIATRLFFERGYHEVTTAEIAELAEVSVPTLFNYFPTKESLVFDEDHQTEQRIIAAVLERRKDQSVFDALLELGLKHLDALKGDLTRDFADFTALVERTPELSAYSRQMWTRYEQSLGAVIRKEAKNKLSSVEAEAIARFILDAYHRTFGVPQPKAMLKKLFKLLKEGWDE